MPATDPGIRRLNGKAGSAARWGTPEEAAEARRELAAERLAAYVKRVVDKAPPLTAAQRERIAAILAAPAGGDAA